MKQPRDLSGREFCRLIAKQFDYIQVRQAGSHARMTSGYMGKEHRITVPLHDHLKPGLLSALLAEVASYLKMNKKSLVEKLFK